MRILERTIKALRFHRWLYLIGGGFVFGFTLLSLCLLTGSQLNRIGQSGFQQRLNQFDPAARHAAADLIAQIQAAYTTVSARYQLWWWLILSGLALLTAVSTIIIAYHRREETAAYLAIGKPPVNISTQYLLESALVFVAGFLVAITLLVYFTRAFDDRLIKLNAALLDQALQAQPSTPDYHQVAARLFAHQMTDFSTSGLVSNHRYLSLAPTQIFGGGRTFRGGLIVVIATQALVYAVSIWWQQRQLSQPH